MTIAIADGILLRACHLTGFTPEEFRSKTRKRTLCQSRQAVIYAIRTRTMSCSMPWSFPQIARYIGLRDHSTILHACRVIGERVERGDPIASFALDLLDAPEVAPGILALQLRRVREERAAVAPSVGGVEVSIPQPAPRLFVNARAFRTSAEIAAMAEAEQAKINAQIMADINGDPRIVDVEETFADKLHAGRVKANAKASRALAAAIAKAKSKSERAA